MGKGKKGIASGYRGLGNIYSTNTEIPQERWDLVFGKKDNKDDDKNGLSCSEQTSDEGR